MTTTPGPWQVVIHDFGDTIPTSEALDYMRKYNRAPVELTIVRGSAAPTGRQMPGTFDLLDRAYRRELYATPASKFGVLLKQAQAMCAGLNAAEASGQVTA